MNREAFEKHFKKQCDPESLERYDSGPFKGLHVDDAIQYAWNGWQASRAELLRELREPSEELVEKITESAFIAMGADYISSAEYVAMATLKTIAEHLTKAEWPIDQGDGRRD